LFTTGDRREYSESKLYATQNLLSNLRDPQAEAADPTVVNNEGVIEVQFDLPKMDSKLIEALKVTISPSDED